MLFFRKNVMAFTGLFLCIFLIVHLGGNLILLLPERISYDLYNRYSHELSENIIIQLTSFVLYLSILLHTLYAITITLKNKSSKGMKYYTTDKNATSSWASQNMGLLGFLILSFIIIHMANFWARIKFGIGEVVPIDQNGIKDVYFVTTQLFKNPYYVVLYVLLMIPLSIHIKHGFSSAFKTLGVYSFVYMDKISTVARIFSIIVLIGFSVIPIVIYLRSL